MISPTIPPLVRFTHEREFLMFLLKLIDGIADERVCPKRHRRSGDILERDLATSELVHLIDNRRNVDNPLVLGWIVVDQGTTLP